MNTNRPFTADSSKLAYAQAFSRTSTVSTRRGPKSSRRRALTMFRRTHKLGL